MLFWILPSWIKEELPDSSWTLAEKIGTMFWMNSNYRLGQELANIECWKGRIKLKEKRNTCKKEPMINIFMKSLKRNENHKKNDWKEVYASWHLLLLKKAEENCSNQLTVMPPNNTHIHQHTHQHTQNNFKKKLCLKAYLKFWRLDTQGRNWLI